MTSVKQISNLLAEMPYAQRLGIEPYSAHGNFTLILPFKEENIGNPFLPALHGGVLGGFMEVTAILKLMIDAENIIPAKPIGINVDYLRSGKALDLFAQAEVTKFGSRIANVQVRAWQSDKGAPIATLAGRFLISGNREKAGEWQN